MDGRHFDALMRTLTETGTRRGLFGLLATLPGLGGLLALLAPDDGAAKGRRTRSVGSENHKRGGRRRKHKAHKKPHPRCKAEALSKTCAGRCGQVKNTCKKTVECGSCVCGDVCASGCPFTALQAAVDAANSGDTIRICAGTYLRADAITDIDKDLTIVGAGDGADPATNTILDADETTTVLRIRSGRTVVVLGLRLTGGVGVGDGFAVAGGVRNLGDLTMSGCTVSGNQGSASRGGPGGIYSDGPLTMTDCTVSENTANSGFAGGLQVRGEFALTRCTIVDNTGFAGGMVVQNLPGTLRECTLERNVASNYAGGLYADNSSGVIQLVNTVIRDNRAPSGGGITIDFGAVITLTDSEVSSNTATNAAVGGGGIWNLGGTVTLENSTVTGNAPDNCAGDPVPGCSG
jgi:hypothetical protein